MANAAVTPWRLGVVSYLNAKPLIEGLDTDPEVELRFDVPARLPALLDAGDVDAALVPVIDLLHPPRRWRIISDACIGCDGETLTVRVFSRCPPRDLRRLYVDGDSHTSVALARVVWPGLFGHRIETRPLEDLSVETMTSPESGSRRNEASPADAQARPRTPLDGEVFAEDAGVLLIGDKVVTHAPTNLEVETDLGSCWKSLTSLPFVFAVWAAPSEAHVDTRTLGMKLSRARDAGVASAELIAADLGPGHGWPVTLAKRYLATRLKFHLGPRQRRGMERFLELAKEHGLVAPTQELVFA